MKETKLDLKELDNRTKAGLEIRKRGNIIEHITTEELGAFVDVYVVNIDSANYVTFWVNGSCIYCSSVE